MRKNNNNNSNIDIDNELVPFFEGLNLKIKTEIKELNRGGCGFFAYFLINCLKEYNINLNAKIVRLEDSKDFNGWKSEFDRFHNDEEKEETYYNLSANHFMVKIGDVYVDGYKCVKTPHFYPSKIDPYVLEQKVGWKHVNGYYSIEEMEIAFSYGNWNDSYDTRQNSRLEKIIKSEVCNFLKTTSY